MAVQEIAETALNNARDILLEGQSANTIALLSDRKKRKGGEYAALAKSKDRRSLSDKTSHLKKVDLQIEPGGSCMHHWS